MEGTFQQDSIVVGVDGSPAGNFALQWAIERASARHLPMHLVHAFAPDLPALGFGAGLDTDSIRAEGDRLLSSAKARVHAFDRSIRVSTSCTRGFASRALVNASHQAKMVVVGAHGHGGYFSGTPYGAVALQVVTHASCPVAVVGHGDTGATPFGRVLVGVDGSDYSLLALQEAFDHAEVRGAELIVLHAWQAQRSDDPTLSAGSDWPAYERAQEELVNRAITEQRRAHPEVKVIQQVLEGDPVKLLRQRAEEADLVVVGSRGTGGFPGLLLGSVAAGILSRTACPILVTRRRPR